MGTVNVLIVPNQPRTSGLNSSLCKSSEKRAFLIGGSAAGKLLSACLLYDLVSNTWEWMPELNTPRMASSSCSLAGSLYVFGGITGQKPNQIERLQIVASIDQQKQKEWEPINPTKLACGLP